MKQFENEMKLYVACYKINNKQYNKNSW